MARTVTDVALMLNVLAGPNDADPLNVTVWKEVARQTPGAVKAGKSQIDYTRFLKADALKGAKLGVVKNFFGGDPEIDALTLAAIEQMKKLGAQTVEITLTPEFVKAYLTDGGRRIRQVADYRFRADWEKYLATLGPDVPKTVADYVKLDETVVNKSPLPVEDSVMRLLTTSLKTSTDDPDYRDLIVNVLPTATRDKMALFEKYGVDALVFPYQSTFAPPIDNPVYKIDDPTFVDSKLPQPTIIAGYSSVGFPAVVVPMGFGKQGLPMDVSFFGRPYEEGRLLGYAYSYEQASRMRKPSALLPPLAGETVTVTQ
jgi:amidase